MNMAFSKGVILILAGVFLSLLGASAVIAQDDSDSSACVNCHTDLEEMDDYGAAAASAAAAVAG